MRIIKDKIPNIDFDLTESQIEELSNIVKYLYLNYEREAYLGNLSIGGRSGYTGNSEKTIYECYLEDIKNQRRQVLKLNWSIFLPIIHFGKL